MTMGKFIILFTFICKHSFAQSIDDTVRKHVDSLKSLGIEKVFIHQLSLFYGRRDIPYDDPELECDNLPIVVHIFWFQGGQWKCLRLDRCGPFNTIDIDKTKFDNLEVDEGIKFKTKSPHFAKYTLTKLYKDDRESVAVSGSQLRDEKNKTIKTFQKINKAIKRLEDSHKFKREK
jgi:hypothetical protein